MAEDSAAGIFGKVVLGGAVGFALFFLATGLGGRRGAGVDEGAVRPSSPRPQPPLPKDDEPLLYVVVESDDAQKLPRPLDLATRVRRDVRFRRLDVGGAKISPDEIYHRMSELLRREQRNGISVDELIARVRAGGRDDVRLISTGGIRAGTWADALDALMGAGIKHWKLWVEAPADRKPGQPPKLPRWDLHDRADTAGNPDKLGHYLFQSAGTAFWDLALPELRVSGEERGHYGRQQKRRTGCR